MPRKLSDIPQSNEAPPVGWHRCKCTGVEDWTSPKKGTPAKEIEFLSQNGESFTDMVFLTIKALSRLSLIANRLCNAPDGLEIPDDDGDAVEFLGAYIHDNAPGKFVDVEIVESTEQFMYEDGPNIGKVGTKTRRKVSFNGYRRIAAAESAPADARPF